MIKYGEALKKFEITPDDMEIAAKTGAVLQSYRDLFLSDMTSAAADYCGIAVFKPENFKKNYGKYLLHLFDNLSSGYAGKGGPSFPLGQCLGGPEGAVFLFSAVRNWFFEKIRDSSENEEEFNAAAKAYGKLIDASSYAVFKDFAASKGYRSEFGAFRYWVLRASQQFSVVAHTFLILLLSFMTLAAIVYFVAGLPEIATLDREEMFVSSLGALLAVWVIVELLNSEIQILRGNKFKISVFVGVAIIALIRDLLIMTLKHESTFVSMSVILAGILALGVTYWFLEKTESRK